MENASKALIIAGAILLSIAIIGVGMAVFQSAQQSVGDADMSAEQVTAFNSKFLSYEGTKNGATVRALCDAVRTNNSQYTDDVSKCIKIESSDVSAATATASDAGSTPAEIATIKQGINVGSRYKVTISYTATGLIKKIGITNP